MATTSCLVKVRFCGSTYVARVGRGKDARTASSTSSPERAAQAAACKHLNCYEGALKVILQPAQKSADLAFGPAIYQVELVEKGGAS